MKKQTQSFKNLIMLQGEDPLITYINPKGKVVFGRKRFGVGDVYITRIITPQMERYIQKVGYSFEITLKSGYKTQACEILLLKED